MLKQRFWSARTWGSRVRCYVKEFGVAPSLYIYLYVYIYVYTNTNTNIRWIGSLSISLSTEPRFSFAAGGLLSKRPGLGYRSSSARLLFIRVGVTV